MGAEASKLGTMSLFSIGVGGMVGGGIFAVLGLAVQMSGGGTMISFIVGGSVALLTSYSYASLSKAYPSQGGTVRFLNKAFGPGVLTGTMNVLLWLSYIVMLSLYSYAFGSYGSSFFPDSERIMWKHVLITSSVLLFTTLNVMGAKAVARSESLIVAIKLAILLSFIALGIWGVDTSHLQPSTWEPPLKLVAGGMIIFIAYEGFELIANAATDAKKPEITLPRAYFASVLFVMALYVMITIVAVGNLSLPEIADARDYALAEAARPFMGVFGFALIAFAALLSTGSAINATLYGSARTSYVIAKEGELPSAFAKSIWRKPIEGLIITSALTLVIANLVNLSGISVMGSGGFLLIFFAVNVANVRMAKDTGSSRLISGIGATGCALAFGVLVTQIASTNAFDLLILVMLLGAALAIELAYRKAAGREIRLRD